MEGAHGKVDNVVVWVLAAPERLLALIDHADHRVQPRLDGDVLAHRGLVAEELLPGIAAQHADVRGALIFRVGIEAALQKGQVQHLGCRGGRSPQDRSGHLLAVVFDGHIADAEHRLHVLKSAVGRHHVRQRAQRQHVVEVQLLAVDLLGRGAHADHRHVKDPDDVRAQRTHPIGDAVVQPVDDRGDGDDRGHADYDAQDRQPRAQLVGPEGIEGHFDGFAGLSLRHESSEGR